MTNAVDALAQPLNDRQLTRPAAPAELTFSPERPLWTAVCRHFPHDNKHGLPSSEMRRDRRARGFARRAQCGVV